MLKRIWATTDWKRLLMRLVPTLLILYGSSRLAYSEGHRIGVVDGILQEKRVMMPMAIECVTDRLRRVEERYAKEHPGKHVEMHIAGPDGEEIIRH